jgi:hypothetical protein
VLSHRHLKFKTYTLKKHHEESFYFVLLKRFNLLWIQPSSHAEER